MYKINLASPINVHFVGIGGISMSGLAQILLKNKFTVSGSDVGRSANVSKLITLGAKIDIGHASNHINDEV